MSGAPTANRPGLRALRYRVGTWASFREAMLRAVPFEEPPEGPHAGTRPLAALRTRASDDPAIALLDAWAVAADVITFYQERIANEGFLRTATERRSVQELSRMVGHHAAPGVAAEVDLAFTVDEGAVAVPAGTRVMSVPVHKWEVPQTFETLRPLDARSEWNAMRALSVREGAARAGDRRALVGLPGAAQPGDALLFVQRDAPAPAWEVRRVVSALPEGASTMLAWDRPLGEGAPEDARYDVHAMRARAPLFGHNAPAWPTPPSFSQAERLDPVARDAGAEWPLPTLSGAWEALAAPPGTLPLDAAYPGAAPGAWVVLLTPGARRLTRAESVDERPTRAFGVSSRVTWLSVPPADLAGATDLPLSDALVLVAGPPMPFATVPAALPVSGGSVLLDRPVPDPGAGRRVAIEGKRMRALAGPTAAGRLLLPEEGAPRREPVAEGETFLLLGLPGEGRAWKLRDARGFEGRVDAPPDAFVLAPAAPGDPTVAEVRGIAEVRTEAGRHARVVLDAPLSHVLDPATVLLNANVARAGHGERHPPELLGGADASAPHQAFSLKRADVTHRLDPRTGRPAPDLDVLVHGVRWRRVEAFRGLGPADRAYVLRVDDEGRATIRFGDGTRGARLPPGEGHVTATYATGLGARGNVPAGTLTLLMTRPLGVKGVTNPLPASGGADAEPLDGAKRAAPRSVRTFGRIVSLPDYVDFARSLPGVGRAQAVLAQGRRPGVLLTLTAADGTPLAEGTPAWTRVVEAILANRADTRPLHVMGPRLATFEVSLRIKVDEDVEAAPVRARVAAGLAAAFAPAARGLGWRVTASQIVMVAHRVPGVVAVELRRLERTDAPQDGPPPSFLVARAARFEGDEPVPSELLVLRPGGALVETEGGLT